MIIAIENTRGNYNENKGFDLSFHESVVTDFNPHLLFSDLDIIQR